MKNIKLFILITIMIIVSVALIYFNLLINNNKYNNEKNNALNYLGTKYIGLEFSIESIVKDPYDTYISEIKEQKQGQMPFIFQVREHKGVITDYFMEEQLGQEDRYSLYEVLGSHIDKIAVKDITVTRNSFASYGITEKNYNNNPKIKEIPIEVSVSLKGEEKIDNESFVDLSIKIRDIILKEHYIVQEIRTHYNYSDKYVGLYLDIFKEDFMSTKEQLKKKVSGHFYDRG